MPFKMEVASQLTGLTGQLRQLRSIERFRTLKAKCRDWMGLVILYCCDNNTNNNNNF